LPTVDRLDPENGSYAPGEFVVTCLFFQTTHGRQWSRDLYEQYVALRSIAHTIEPVQDRLVVMEGARDLLTMTELHTRERREKDDIRGTIGIDETFITDLYYAQRGCCAIGNTPIYPWIKSKSKSGVWSWSLDRIDDSQGYIKGNVRLVWINFNLPVKLSVSDVQAVFD
jgi:hypothetical protein